MTRKGKMARLNNPPLSAYRFMWMLVMFDLPVGSKAERRNATRFRQWLLDEGFEMSQFSVYLRFCAGKEQVERRVRAVTKALPPRGKVHVLSVTDRQFEQMVVFHDAGRGKSRGVPRQLELF